MGGRHCAGLVHGQSRGRLEGQVKLFATIVFASILRVCDHRVCKHLMCLRPSRVRASYVMATVVFASILRVCDHRVCEHPTCWQPSRLPASIVFATIVFASILRMQVYKWGRGGMQCVSSDHTTATLRALRSLERFSSRHAAIRRCCIQGHGCDIKKTIQVNLRIHPPDQAGTPGPGSTRGLCIPKSRLCPGPKFIRGPGEPGTRKYPDR